MGLAVDFNHVVRAGVAASTKWVADHQALIYRVARVVLPLIAAMVLIVPYLTGVYELWRSHSVNNLFFKDLNYQDWGFIKKFFKTFSPFHMYSLERVAFFENITPKMVEGLSFNRCSKYQLSVLASRQEVVCALNNAQLCYLFRCLDFKADILSSQVADHQRAVLVDDWIQNGKIRFPNIEWIQWYFDGCRNAKQKNDFFALLSSKEKESFFLKVPKKIDHAIFVQQALRALDKDAIKSIFYDPQVQSVIIQHVTDEKLNSIVQDFGEKIHKASYPSLLSRCSIGVFKHLMRQPSCKTAEVIQCFNSEQVEAYLESIKDVNDITDFFLVLKENQIKELGTPSVKKIVANVSVIVGIYIYEYVRSKASPGIDYLVTMRWIRQETDDTVYYEGLIEKMKSHVSLIPNECMRYVVSQVGLTRELFIVLSKQQINALDVLKIVFLKSETIKAGAMFSYRAEEQIPSEWLYGLDPPEESALTSSMVFLQLNDASVFMLSQLKMMDPQQFFCLIRRCDYLQLKANFSNLNQTAKSFTGLLERRFEKILGSSVKLENFIKEQQEVSRVSDSSEPWDIEYRKIPAFSPIAPPGSSEEYIIGTRDIREKVQKKGLKCFQIFGFDKLPADQSEVKKKYRALTLLTHPDKNGNTAQEKEAREFFELVGKAYAACKKLF